MKNSLTKRRSGIRTAVVAGLLAVSALGAAGSALAEGNPTEEREYDSWNAVNGAGQLERCAAQSEAFRFRFYYHQNYTGAWINIGQSIWDLKDVVTGYGGRPLPFCGTTDGGGQNVANNAASAYNWYEGYCATVYYYAGYAGASSGKFDSFSPRSGHNLGPTRNNNRSIQFASCTRV